MPISLIFPVVLLLWVTSCMFDLRCSDPHGKHLAAAGLVIIGLLALIIWHDLGFIVHSWALFD